MVQGVAVAICFLCFFTENSMCHVSEWERKSVEIFQQHLGIPPGWGVTSNARHKIVSTNSIEWERASERAREWVQWENRIKMPHKIEWFFRWSAKRHTAFANHQNVCESVLWNDYCCCCRRASSSWLLFFLRLQYVLWADVSLSVITAFLYYSLVVPFSLPFSLSLCISYFFFRLLYLFLPFLEMFSRDFMAVWFEMAFSHTWLPNSTLVVETLQGWLDSVCVCD